LYQGAARVLIQIQHEELEAVFDQWFVRLDAGMLRHGEVWNKGTLINNFLFLISFLSGGATVLLDTL
jgi:hypothetical protein